MSQIAENETALSRPTGTLSVFDTDPGDFKRALDRRKQNRNQFIQWIRSDLVKDVDFGSVPTKRGMSKPSLWKAGAEKVTGQISAIATFPTLADY